SNSRWSDRFRALVDVPDDLRGIITQPARRGASLSGAGSLSKVGAVHSPGAVSDGDRVLGLHHVAAGDSDQTVVGIACPTQIEGEIGGTVESVSAGGRVHPIRAL